MSQSGKRESGPPARILIVDDEAENRELLGLILEHEGYLTVTATCGEEALGIVALEPVDLIMLDFIMPGMDGREVAAKIKGNPATMYIPIVMVSAMDDHDSRMLAKSAGAADFFTKPMDRAELCERVRKILGVRRVVE